MAKGQLEPQIITYISESHTFIIQTTTNPLNLYHILLRYSDSSFDINHNR